MLVSDPKDSHRTQKARNIEEDVYLNFNHRPQRLIIYNLVTFLWSISHVVHYANVISNDSRDSVYRDSTNSLLFVYYAIVGIASAIVLFTFYYQLSVNDLSRVHIGCCTLAGNPLHLSVMDAMCILVGLLYFISFLFHFAITWTMSGDVCHGDNKTFGCYLTIISSTFFSMAFPLIWSSDLLDNFLRTPNKRILSLTVLIFASSFIYMFEFEKHNFGENVYYLSSYIRFAQTAYWMICAATAVIYICEGFHHEGILKIYVERLVSFVLLCAPVVAFDVNYIAFGDDGQSTVHESWFLLVVFCVFTAYDLQRLPSYKVNEIGAQNSAQERLITECVFDSHKQPQYRAPIASARLSQLSQRGSLNAVQQVDMDDLSAVDRDDDEEEQKYSHEQTIKPQKQPLQQQNMAFDYLVFKKYGFHLHDKKQRLLILNTLFLIYGVGKFMYVFNFWINLDQASFLHLKQLPPNERNFDMHLSELSYQLYGVSFAAMITLSIAVIFMEWFVVPKQQQLAPRFAMYRYSCAALYVALAVLHLFAVINGSSDYCKHLDRVMHVDRVYTNYFCHMQYVAKELLSIALPLAVLSIDVASVSALFYDHIKVRVLSLQCMICVASVLFYVGCDRYYGDAVTEYQRFKLSGFLMIASSLLFSAALSTIFAYVNSTTFSKIANFIASLLIIIGVSIVLDVDNANINIVDWVLFVPLCCLVAYEVLLF